jgi:hypothetical protein
MGGGTFLKDQRGGEKSIQLTKYGKVRQPQSEDLIRRRVCSFEDSQEGWTSVLGVYQKQETRED